MLKIVTSKNLEKELNKIRRRDNLFEDAESIKLVRKILADIKVNGDKACLKYTKRFDKVDIEAHYPVQKDILRFAKQNISAEFDCAMRKVIKNLTEYNLHQVPSSWTYKRPNDAVVGLRHTPIKRVGIYVPGGKALYPSSLLMSVVPARVAGVQDIVVVTPPGSNGLPSLALLAACFETGIKEIYPMGGVQAIGALAYGTETIKKVDLIVGPGNLYVTLAKKEVFGLVGIDKLAGPSESIIVADRFQNSDFVACDILVQAEHDELASSILIAFDKKFALAVKKKVASLVEKSPRKKILKKSLKNWSIICVVKDINQAAAICNLIGPEHLQIMLKNDLNYKFFNKINNAGAVFIGPYSPETVGDYTAGPNHVLPTNGTCRFSAPLGVMDFVHSTSIIEYSKKALKEEAAEIKAFAKMENLPAHGQSIDIRFKSKKKKK